MLLAFTSLTDHSANDSATVQGLKHTQDRLQLIIDHIDTITNVNNFQRISVENQSEIIMKFKELLHTLDHLPPGAVPNILGMLPGVGGMKASPPL